MIAVANFSSFASRLCAPQGGNAVGQFGAILEALHLPLQFFPDATDHPHQQQDEAPSLGGPRLRAAALTALALVMYTFSKDSDEGSDPVGGAVIRRNSRGPFYLANPSPPSYKRLHRRQHAVEN